MIYKIAIVGPESTGKSYMAQFLAKHFNTVFVEEYAREYCKDLNNIYTLQDELNMFYGQKDLEIKQEQKANRFLFCDTSLLSVKIWCDELFGSTPNDICDEINSHKYDLYLLMDIDLPWEEDSLRDFKDRREYFFSIFEQELSKLDTPVVKISGLDTLRTQNAIDAINTYFNK